MISSVRLNYVKQSINSIRYDLSVHDMKDVIDDSTKLTAFGKGVPLFSSAHHLARAIQKLVYYKPSQIKKAKMMCNCLINSLSVKKFA